MAEKRKQHRREVVIPFVGEEKFVVPKKGGFGQPDNEHYVMVSGDVPSVSKIDMTPSPPVPPPTGGIFDTGGGGVLQPPPLPVLPAIPVYKDFPSMSCSEKNDYLNYLQTFTDLAGNTSLPENQRFMTEMANLKADITTKCSPVVVTLPNFPNWELLDCSTLKSEIARIEGTMATSKFSAEVANAYNNALAIAKPLYNTKCPINPITIGGGGGGGLGEAPTDTTTPVATKKSYTWLWILLAIGGAYFLTRKKKA